MGWRRAKVTGYTRPQLLPVPASYDRAVQIDFDKFDLNAHIPNRECLLQQPFRDP